MTTLSFPSGFRAPGGFRFGLVPNTQTFESPLSRAVQTFELPGARWEVTATWNNLNAVEIRALRAWLASLRGRAGRFYYGDLAHASPSGVATGTPMVKGGSQTGNTLITDGWTTSTAGILLAGDYFAVNGELKMLTADATSNGLGEATLTFEPPLRASPADNAALTVTAPQATFRLKEDTADLFTWRPGLLADFTLDAIEVFA